MHTGNAAPRRNAACSCGSGKKFKHCCAPATPAVQPSPLQPQRELAVTQQLLNSGHATAAYQRASNLLAALPQLPHGHYLAGLAAWQLGEWPTAERHFQAATQVPGEVRYFINWGALLLNQGRAGEALAVFERGLQHHPQHEVLHFNAAQAHSALGTFDAAAQAYRSTLRLIPGHSGALFGLAQSQRHSEAPATHTLLAEILTALERAERPASRCELNYALCKVYDDLGHIDGAMAAAHRANAIEAASQPYRDERYAALCAQLLRRDRADKLPLHHAAPSEGPLLIVGLPRSGTSLVEQILTRHPDVGSAGELDFWEKIARSIGNGIPPPAVLAEVATAYRRLLQQCSPGRRLVIDKMPDNFWHVGLFLRAFPQGKVIHCRRNPIDTGLSIYLHRFTGVFDYSHRLEDIARYTEHYRTVTRHWQQQLPAHSWLDIDYETLVLQSSSEIRRIADFVGLPWCDDMLAPHAGQQAVRTSSAWQVRQPIYRHAVERWRRYERHLEPLLSLLEVPAVAA